MSIFDVAAKNTLEITRPNFETQYFNDRIRARDFVWQYAKTFCVYCPITQNLYADYDFYNTDCDRNVVVLPKNDYLSTFPRINEGVIQQTPFMLIPNGKLSRAHLLNRQQRDKSLPAGDALLNLAESNNLFPVIIKSDLKRLKSDLPFLMLRAISINTIKSHSTFNKNQMRTAILEKLETSANQWRG